MQTKSTEKVTVNEYKRRLELNQLNYYENYVTHHNFAIGRIVGPSKFVLGTNQMFGITLAVCEDIAIVRWIGGNLQRHLIGVCGELVYCDAW